MSVNLTKVQAKVNDIKKKIYYDSTISPLRLYNVNELLGELTEGWFLSTFPVSNMALGAEYWELSVVDLDGGLDLTKIIPMTTAVEINGERYRVMPYARPRIATKKWYLRIETTGERY